MLAEGQIIRLVRQGDGDVQPSFPDTFGARQNIVAAGAGDALLAEEGDLLGPLDPRNEGLDVLSRGEIGGGEGDPRIGKAAYQVVVEDGVQRAQRHRGVFPHLVDHPAAHRDEGEEDIAATLADADGLVDRPLPLLFLEEVVKRPHEEDRVEGAVRKHGKVQGVALERADARFVLPRLLFGVGHVGGRKVEQRDGMALPRVMDAVAARPAPDVEDRVARLQIAVHPGGRDPELVGVALLEAVPFLLRVLVVMALDLIRVRSHGKPPSFGPIVACRGWQFTQ
jgi:hypothetical protein